MRRGEKVTFIGFSEAAVKVLLVGVESVLLLLAIVSTSRVSGYEEHTDYAIDNIFVQILILLAVIVSIYLFSVWYGSRKRAVRFSLPGRWGMGILLAAYLLLCLYWVCHTRFSALGDSAVVMEIARQMQGGDYSAFRDLGYAERHFNQQGMLFLLKTVFDIVGSQNDIVFQYLNVFSVGVLIFSLWRLSEELWGRRAGQAAALLLILFLPLGLYTVFVYGNVFSWALIALAFWQEVKYLRTGRVIHGVVMGAAISSAVLLKSFSLIALIAMFLYGVYEGILRRRHFSVFVCLAAPVLVIFLAGKAGDAYIDDRLDGYERRQMPALGYVAMGMQESYMAPGWYNGIHDQTYQACGGERAAMERAFRDMIRSRLEEFAENPGEAIWFYGRKTASQWNNPSFQGLWFGEICQPRTEVPGWIASAYQGKIRKWLDPYLNGLLTVLHGGILAYLTLGWKKIRMEHLLPGIYFVGGFLFLFFWEAKCQYTMGFFLFMIPYCFCGYREVFWRLNRLKQNE